MQHYHHHPKPHLAAAYGGADAVSSDVKRGKKRGSYNCGRCGLPKKGHNCNLTTPTSASSATPADLSLSAFSAVSAATSGGAGSPPSPPPPSQPYSRLRRALSFDDVDDRSSGFDPLEMSDGEEERDLFIDPEPDLDSSGLPANVLWEVLKRLPPTGLLSAAKVCKGWRDTTRKLWKAAEELRLRVPFGVQVGFVASMLQKCPGIMRLSLRMERCGFFLIHRGLSDLCFK